MPVLALPLGADREIYSRPARDPFSVTPPADGYSPRRIPLNASKLALPPFLSDFRTRGRNPAPRLDFASPSPSCRPESEQTPLAANSREIPG